MGGEGAALNVAAAVSPGPTHVPDCNFFFFQCLRQGSKQQLQGRARALRSPQSHSLGRSPSLHHHLALLSRCSGDRKSQDKDKAHRQDLEQVPCRAQGPRLTLGPRERLLRSWSPSSALPSSTPGL